MPLKRRKCSLFLVILKIICPFSMYANISYQNRDLLKQRFTKNQNKDTFNQNKDLVRLHDNLRNVALIGSAKAAKNASTVYVFAQTHLGLSSEYFFHFCRKLIRSNSVCCIAKCFTFMDRPEMIQSKIASCLSENYGVLNLTAKFLPTTQKLNCLFTNEHLFQAGQPVLHAALHLRPAQP